MADWDFLDEVDVLAKLPPNFNEQLESKKWVERKEALEALLGILTANPRLSTKVNYGELVNTLQVVLAKDANINVNALAARCLAGIAAGLRNKFSSYAQQLIPVITERFKEKKPLLKEPLVECIDSIAATVTLESITEEVSTGMEKQNPQIKQQMDLFIYRQMNKIPTDKAPRKLIKAVVPILAKHACDADVEVREAALSAIGSVQRLIGEKNVRSMLGDLEKDDIKMKKIAEYMSKAAAVAEEEIQKGASREERKEENGKEEGDQPAPAATSTAATKKPKEADPWDFLEPFDVLSKVPASFQEGVESKKWQERKESLEGLHSLLQANPRLCPKANYGEMVCLLRRLLEKDANINVCALATKCVTGIAIGLRAKFVPHASTVLPAVLEKFKEKKPLVKDALVECIDVITTHLTLESMEDDLTAALGKANPSIKTQTALFLRRFLVRYTPATMPKKTLKIIAPLLVKSTGDPEVEVREASYAALGTAMCIVGEKPSLVLLADIADDKLKMSKIREFCDKVREEVGDLHVQQPPVAVAKNEPPSDAKAAPKKDAKATKEKEVKSEAEEEEEKVKTSTAGSKKEKGAGKKEDAVEEESKKPKGELFALNSNKQQRIKDEKTLKILKWNFSTPDEEHISQLMTMIGVEAKASFLSLLFHKDFKMHIKAVDTLIAEASSQPEALVKNSDLILKWCTLRFFETNPAVLIKVLELARLTLELCREADEPLSNEEINAFVPYLLLKTGEQKENMRVVVREIVEVLTLLAGPLRLCPLIIEALKTKNSRQRAECLIVLEKYVDTVGLSQLKTQGIVKAMAGCVGDRDTNVRNAAINGVVAAFREEGEKVWALTGKMADKDKALVDERIKRSGAMPGNARPGTATREGGPKIVSQPNGVTVRGMRPSSQTREGSRTRDSSPVSSRQEQRNYSSQEKMNSTYTQSPKKFDLADFEERYSSTRGDVMTLSTVLSKLDMTEIPAPSKYSNSSGLRRSNSSSSIASVDTFDQLDKVIQNISSALPEVWTEALAQIHYILGVDEQRPLLGERMDIILSAVAAQLKILRTIQLVEESEKTNERLRLLLNFLTALTVGDVEIRRASASALVPLFMEMICSLVDENINTLPDGLQILKSINVISIRCVSKMEPSAVLGALCECLGKAYDQKLKKQSDLFCKCIHKMSTEIGSAPKVNAEQMVQYANEFLRRGAERGREESKEASQAVLLAIEKLFVVNALQANQAIRRLQRPDPNLVEVADAIMKKLPQGGLSGFPSNPSVPGEVFADFIKGMHPLVANIFKNYENLPKSIPILGDHIIAHKSDLPVIESQISKLDLLVEGLTSSSIGSPIDTSVPQRSSVETVALPAVTTGSTVETVKPQPKRRTLKPEDLAPLKERLNQISS